MSRIIGDRVASAVTLDLEKIEKVISEHFATKANAARAESRRVRTLNHNRLKAEMLQVVNLVIAPQIEKGYRLDLCDKIITSTLNVSDRRAKQIRLELKDAGITWFPEWSRPRKEGDYPYWMVVKDFIIIPRPEKKKFKPKTSKKYNQSWCRMYDQAKKDVFADLELYSMYVTVKQFMMMVYQTIDSYISRLGLTKQSFLI